MIDKLERLLLIRENFEKDTPVLAEHNNDPKRVVFLLLNEVSELLQEVMSDAPIERIGDELADVFLFTMVLFKQYQLDMFEEVGAKTAYNCDRFKPLRNRDMPFSEGYSLAKKHEKQDKIKEMYAPSRNGV